MESAYRFARPLTEGVIESRPNRFITVVKIGSTTVNCHCPATGRIGDIVFKNIPCLLTEHDDDSRKTRCTVEAISLDPIEINDKTWIGINQAMANRYLEYFMVTRQLEGILGDSQDIKREVKLGKSRIDFKIGNTFVEVKSPLTEIPYSPNVGHRKLPPMTSFDRLIKHFGELTNSIGSGEGAILLLCYQFDAPPFHPPPMDHSNEKIEKAAMDAERRGLENWQVNLKIDRSGVSLLRYFRLELFDRSIIKRD